LRHSAQVGYYKRSTCGKRRLHDQWGVLIPPGGNNQHIKILQNTTKLAVGKSPAKTDFARVGKRTLSQLFESPTLAANLGEVAINAQHGVETGGQALERVDQQVHTFVLEESSDKSDTQRRARRFFLKWNQRCCVDAERHFVNDVAADAVFHEYIAHKHGG